MVQTDTESRPNLQSTAREENSKHPVNPLIAKFVGVVESIGIATPYAD